MSTVALPFRSPLAPVTTSAWTLDHRLEWALVPSLLYFACHGVFSFQSEGEASGGFLPGRVVSHEHGLIGYLMTALVYGTIAWLVVGRWKSVLPFARHFKLFTLLAVMTVCSALWSQDPPRSLLYGTFYLVGTLFAYWLVLRFEPEEIMALMIKTGWAISLLGMLIIVLLPKFGVSTGTDEARSNAWIGLFIDRTSAAKCLVFLLSPALVHIRRPFKLAQIGYILLLCLMIVKARAATAILAPVLYVTVLTGIRVFRQSRGVLTFLLSLCLLLPLGILAVAGSDVFSTLLEALGRNATLSGRLEVWRAVLVSISKQPLLGYGFRAFWQGMVGESANVIHMTNWSFGYAHNGILEIWLQLGLVGVVLFSLTLMKAMRDGWYCFRNDPTGRYDWYLGLVALTVFYNIDEGTVVFPNELLSILYLVMCCGLSMAAMQLKRNRSQKAAFSV
jgi:exopolysaccharide production protein ExoQ